MNELITVLVVVSFITICYLLYKITKLQMRIKEMDKEHRKLVADAGMAITETMKVAFDNLKQLNQKHERLSVIVKDNKEKIQNIMVGSRPNKTGKIDKVARFRAAVDAAKEDQKILDDMEDLENER